MIASAAALCIAIFAFSLAQSPSSDPLVEGFRQVEVASVADAIEQLYGKKMYMYHEMRPLFTAKFAGPAATVLMKKD
jgi:4-hydroxy-4-methyl-2-oxoglutarate aldolase